MWKHGFTDRGHYIVCGFYADVFCHVEKADQYSI